jgi:hypothetical protein
LISLHPNFPQSSYLTTIPKPGNIFACANIACKIFSYTTILPANKLNVNQVFIYFLKGDKDDGLPN